MSVEDDKTILAKTAVGLTMLACPLRACVYFVEVPEVQINEDVANALGMTGRGMAQLHAEQAAWRAADTMRKHLSEHTPEEWLTRYPRTQL